MKRQIQTIVPLLYFDGPLDDVILRLEELKKHFKDYEGLRITEDVSYKGGYTYALQRLETDEEYKNRKKIEDDRVKELDNIDRIQYERLKLKFEK